MPEPQNSPAEAGVMSRFGGLILFVCMTAGFFVLTLTLFTYESTDPGFSRFNSRAEVHNIFGNAGAWASDLFYLLFGWGSWLFVLAALYFLIVGFKRLRGRSSEDKHLPTGIRIFGFMTLLLAFCALAFLRLHTFSGELPGTSGGALGSAIGTEMLYWMNFSTATYVLLFVIAASACVFFGFSWIDVSEKSGKFLEDLGSGLGAIRQNKADTAAGKASLEEREKLLHEPQMRANAALRNNDLPAGQVAAVVPMTAQAPASAQSASLVGSSGPISASSAPISASGAPNSASGAPISASNASSSLSFSEGPSIGKGAVFAGAANANSASASFYRPIDVSAPAPAASSSNMPQPPMLSESDIFGSHPTEKVKGLNEFKPIEFKPEEELVTRVSVVRSDAENADYADDAYNPDNAYNAYRGENRASVSPAGAPFRETNHAADADDFDDSDRVIPIETAEIDEDPVEEDALAVAVNSYADFVLPNATLLTEPPFERSGISQEELRLTSQRIEHILMNYKINAKVLSAFPGPIITRFKVQPGVGVKSRKFVEVAKDLARGLGQPNVRVVENLREVDCIGLEVPNSGQSVQTIYLKEIINSHVFKQSTSRLTLALGKSVSGEPMVIDLAKAPHLLVAGTTGSGKSVGVNAMILSMLYKNKPDQLKLILIDPKEVEFGLYEEIPHLLTPVITDMAKAAHALKWSVKEMDHRYKLLRQAGVRNFDAYNAKIRESREQGNPLMNRMSDPPVPLEEMPYIIIIVDEYSDLIMTYGKEVEQLITRLTQKARAAGMHVILATQRPSTDVVTAVIKANCPSRISFQVSNRYDSMTILNTPGAEELLGRGDMFYMHPSSPLRRVHGAYVTDEEISNVTDYLRSQGRPNYVDGVTEPDEEPEEEVAAAAQTSAGRSADNNMYDRAVEIVVTNNRPSICYVQRRLNIGYNRAANLIEQMEKDGIVSKPTQNGKRVVLAPKPAFED